MTTSDTPRAVPLKDADKRPSGLSLIWLIPFLAVAVAIGVAFQNWSNQGPVIEVVFAQAEGVRPQETELRYRDIPVGLVEAVRFSDNLDEVIAEIRLDKDVAPYVDAESTFWVVRPQVTAQGVSGLDTVLSGVYIAGAWDGVKGAPETRFTGQKDAPLLALGEEGITFILRSEEGLPTENTPILYRGVQVGRMGPTEVSDDGLLVLAEAVILEPYTQLVSSSTRFWDISGFSFSLGTQGASIDFSSVASLISGGVTFETMASGGTPLAPGAEFTVHADEESAREDFFLEGEGGSLTVMMIFEENLAGLQAGAAVSLGGLRIGEVETISGIVDEARFGDAQVRLMVTARVNPGRIGLDTDATEDAFLAYFDERVAGGLRARLTNASILTGGLKIELVDLAEVPPAIFDRTTDPYPSLPTAASNVANVAASAQGLLARVEALPVEELLAEATGFLSDARGVIGSEEVQAAPEALLATLDSIRTIAESAEVAALPAQIGTVAEELAEASATLNALLGDVQDRAVVAAVTDLIASLDETAATLPGLADQAGAVLTKVEDVPLDEITTRVTTLLDDADALLTDENLTAIPADLRAALGEVRALVASEEIAALPAQVGDLTTGLTEAADRLNALLEQAQQDQIVTSVSDLIASLGNTADRLPGIADQASAVLSDAEQLSLDELATQARQLLASIDALVDQPDTRDLPGELNDALSELRLTLAELREGGVVENANATLASARRAAEAIADASRTLPELSARLSRVADQAGVTISAYGRGSDFGRELSAAIRGIEEAASSIDRLARQIARNPNSLITGR